MRIRQNLIDRQILRKQFEWNLSRQSDQPNLHLKGIHSRLGHFEIVDLSGLESIGIDSAGLDVGMGNEA